MVRDYLRLSVDGFPFGAYLTNRVQLNAQQRRAIQADPRLRYVLQYADPVGESAVRNVMRGRAS